MFTKINLGGEESEQSLPSWISDHLGAKSYIDETSQSPPPNSPKMDTSSLTKEGNVMTQAELDKLGSTYSFPSGIRLRIPGDGETILSARQGEVAFYEAAFLAGLRLPLHPTIREILIHYKICPAQLSPNAWRSVICWLSKPDKNLLRGSPSNVKGWKTSFSSPRGTSGSSFRARPPAILCEFSKSWGTPGKSCNKLPTLSEVDAKRTEAILGKIEPRGYFEVSKVLGSRTFNKILCGWVHGALYQWRGQHDLGRALPGIPDETLLRWLGGKVKDPFTNLLSGTSGSSSDLGSVSISDSELPPELRSDGDEGDDSQASHQRDRHSGETYTEGIPVVEIGGPDLSKGKEAAPPPAPKRFKSNRGAINARGPAAGAGTSSLGGDVGSESMSDASVARRLLTGVIPASDKEEVDRLSENDLVAKSFHALGQAENKLAELSEDGSKPGNEVDDLKATVAELTNKLAKAKELAIENFKASENSRQRLQILLRRISVRALCSARGSSSINSPT
ncbi:hypothetical protein Acr_14g0001820 [Actinidia rufa]|uniref:Transposase (putative) gypsy type domain-containing protein n=1 Tax=Actinidia rufa TaxID=165716 RepID=A0A7J0FQ91_9ERIC|nr:hypothetical protein Acr_14g0001820 [Actinidia rufa]